MAMSAYTKPLQKPNPATVPVSKPLLGRKDEMVRNNDGGGFVFELDKWGILDRFLILGAEGGTYYVKEKKLVKQNNKNLLACIAEDGVRVVKTLTDVSVAGRAPKEEPVILALASVFTYGDVAAREAAELAFNQVIRMGTQLFQFITCIQSFGKWNRRLRRTVANWYLKNEPSKVAYQVAKYQNRENVRHLDVLRLAHAKPVTSAQKKIFGWLKTGELSTRSKDLQIIEGLMKAREATSATEVVKLIHKYELTREMVPTQFLNSPEVWQAMLQHMPLKALVRNLGKMTSIGVTSPLSTGAEMALAKLSDVEYIRKSRLHPLGVLIAQRVYASGHGVKGDLHWSPNQQIVDALDDAFYAAFENAEPTGQRLLLAIDCSDSMTWADRRLPGTLVSSREAAAAMALATAKVEKNYHIMGFSHTLVDLPITPKMRLKEACDVMSRVRAGSTDCSLPFRWASQEKIPNIGGFVVYTDNETNSGIHPSQALKNYREGFSRKAKLAVVGMCSTSITIADPKDPGMMDFVGFDASAPAVLADFLRD